jgi:hypothetical protein
LTETPKDPVRLPRQTKGKRPGFFDDPSADQMMTFILELATEVAVMRERLDTVECLLDEQGSVTREAIESFEPSPEVEQRRSEWLAAYYGRVLRMHPAE